MSTTVILQLLKTTNSYPPLKNKTRHELILSAGIRLWNGLQTEIKDPPTVPAFASGLNKCYAF